MGAFVLALLELYNFKQKTKTAKNPSCSFSYSANKNQNVNRKRQVLKYLVFIIESTARFQSLIEKKSQTFFVVNSC